MSLPIRERLFINPVETYWVTDKSIHNVDIFNQVETSVSYNGEQIYPLKFEDKLGTIWYKYNNAIIQVCLKDGTIYNISDITGEVYSITFSNAYARLMKFHNDSIGYYNTFATIRFSKTGIIAHEWCSGPNTFKAIIEGEKCSTLDINTYYDILGKGLPLPVFVGTTEKGCGFCSTNKTPSMEYLNLYKIS